MKKQINVKLGFGAAVGVTIILLKLCNVIQWSWRWILAPVWITAVLSLVLLGGGIVIMVLREDNERK